MVFTMRRALRLFILGLPVIVLGLSAAPSGPPW